MLKIIVFKFNVILRFYRFYGIPAQMAGAFYLNSSISTILGIEVIDIQIRFVSFVRAFSFGSRDANVAYCQIQK